MERAGKTLWKALRRMARPERPADLLAAVWPLIVGPRLAAHTRPLTWTEGRLRIGVEPGAWKAQVEQMARPIRDKVNAWWGKPLVRQIEFVGRRQRAAAAPRKARAARKPPLSPEELQDRIRLGLKELEGSLAGIADDELRELIARVAARYLDKSSP